MPIIALLGGLCACCSSGGNHSTDPPTEPKDVTAMTPAERYAGYLAGFGITPATTRVVVVPGLTLGRFEFFHLDTGGAGREYKAAASPSGLVAAGARPDDAWHEFVSAAPPEQVARRIAWLETRDHIDPHQSHLVQALTPAERPAAAIDPAQWSLVTAPSVARDGDRLVFTGWLYASGSRAPIRWRITAPATGPATIETVSAEALATPQDPIARALSLLGAPAAEDRSWALRTLGAHKHAAAVPRIVALLQDPDADVRSAAASALGTIGDSSAISHLRDAFTREADSGQRRSIAKVLEQFGDPAVPVLSSLAAAETAMEVRLHIVHALGHIGTPAARKALEERAARDADPAVKKLAASYVQTLR